LLDGKNAWLIALPCCWIFDCIDSDPCYEGCPSAIAAFG
jgi:hypothetical protein